MRAFILAITLVASTLTPASSLWAWAGGPWGGDVTTDDNGSGTYSAVMTGVNLTGIATFGSDPSLGGVGFYVLFHEGESYFGEMGAVVDTASRLVAGVSSSGGASFGFLADIYDTIPQIRFAGEGLLDSLFTPSTNTSVIESVTSSSTTVTANGTTTTSTTVSDQTVYGTNQQVKFTITGARLTNQIGDAFSSPLGSPSTGNGSGNGTTVP
jgi:hypothetical protein